MEIITLEKEISIKQFIQAIKRLPSDEPFKYSNKWYRTQKEHWLGWLNEYKGAGYYGRKGVGNRDAKFAYNHIVEPLMLLYLIQAIPLHEKLIQASKEAFTQGSTMMAKSGAIRKVVPWSEIYQAIWGK